MYSAPNQPDSKNMFIALIMCAVLIMGWQYFVEIPKRERLAAWQTEQIKLKKQKEANRAKEAASLAADIAHGTSEPVKKVEPAFTPRLKISSPNLHGSLALRGLRFDDLTLAKYKQELDKTSPEVVLLTPGKENTMPYFAQIGWLSDSDAVAVPNDRTIWQADKEILSINSPVTLSWNNSQGVTFRVEISLDKHYMFTIRQSVINHSANAVTLTPYALINRGMDDTYLVTAISHEGPLGVLDSALKEITYSDLREESKSMKSDGGWVGFTDKYWLTALIPNQAQPFQANFTHYVSREINRYQSDMTAPAMTIPADSDDSYTMHLFTGAKEIDALDLYTEGDASINLKPVPLFDRAVDFGALYFLTKPLFLTLNFFYAHIGNFGIAILLLTLLIKAIMFPLANKGYKSMTAMKSLQPEMTRIRSQYKDDKLKMQQEFMALYRKEKVNPASGCLPMLIQLPVFFALYKVLFVTIEMRHAPFFGPWQDLSAMDPTNIFNLFGLIPWMPPEWLMLGILPILMAVTMKIQMSQQPTPPDPMQAKVMKFMPYFLLFIIHRMPAGLVLYWVCSNTLSIIQQQVITSKHKKSKEKKG